MIHFIYKVFGQKMTFLLVEVTQQYYRILLGTNTRRNEGDLQTPEN